jgi:hypothetical protein
MRDILDSNLLRCFLFILDHHKLTTTADKLRIIQPVLSKNPQRLERKLGVQLFTERRQEWCRRPMALPLGIGLVKYSSSNRL